MDAAAERRWLDQWKGAARALEEQRRIELRALTPAHALAAAEALLSLASPERLPVNRRIMSGLVEQQRLFHRRERA